MDTVMSSSEWQEFSAFLGCSAIFGVILLALYIWIFWRILGKAGYSPWLSLLNLVPFGMLAILLVLAFGRWPVFSASAYQPTSYYGSASGGGYVPPAPSYTSPVQPPAPPAPPAAPPAEPPATPPTDRPYSG
ncbi:MAG: hypothetical protein AB2L09_11335 [Coriobacteriia bacterium]